MGLYNVSLDCECCGTTPVGETFPPVCEHRVHGAIVRREQPDIMNFYPANVAYIFAQWDDQELDMRTKLLPPDGHSDRNLPKYFTSNRAANHPAKLCDEVVLPAPDPRRAICHNGFLPEPPDQAIITFESTDATPTLKTRIYSADPGTPWTKNCDGDVPPLPCLLGGSGDQDPNTPRLPICIVGGLANTEQGGIYQPSVGVANPFATPDNPWNPTNRAYFLHSNPYFEEHLHVGARMGWEYDQVTPPTQYATLWDWMIRNYTGDKDRVRMLATVELKWWCGISVSYGIAGSVPPWSWFIAPPPGIGDITRQFRFSFKLKDFANDEAFARLLLEGGWEATDPIQDGANLTLPGGAKFTADPLWPTGVNFQTGQVWTSGIKTQEIDITDSLKFDLQSRVLGIMVGFNLAFGNSQPTVGMYAENAFGQQFPGGPVPLRGGYGTGSYAQANVLSYRFEER